MAGLNEEVPPNPPGYGETIGCVVEYEPAPHVVEAACVALHGSALWKHWKRDWPGQIDFHRIAMRHAIRAAAEATRDGPPLPSPALTTEGA